MNWKDESHQAFEMVVGTILFILALELDPILFETDPQANQCWYQNQLTMNMVMRINN